MSRTPFFTCDLMGGIGNQMFQIAAIHGLSKQFDSDYGIVEGQFSGGGQCNHPSSYYDSIFKKVPRTSHLPSPISLHTEKRWTYYDMESEIRADLDSNRDLKGCMIRGYFQSDRYFKDEQAVRELFTPEEGIPEFLKSCSDLFVRYPELFLEHDFCFIGVRRGDYVERAYFHNPCEMNYYKNAMKLIPATKYYIASDDIAWCKEQFKGDQYVFFDIASDLHQLYVGCLFKNYIIGNSSFNWWMSFLSVYPSPTIIAPNKWVFGPNVKWEEYSTIYRKGMIVLER